MTTQKRQSAASKRAASPAADNSPPPKEVDEPRKKRGRTTRRSLAAQAEEDAAANIQSEDKRNDMNDDDSAELQKHDNVKGHDDVKNKAKFNEESEHIKAEDGSSNTDETKQQHPTQVKTESTDDDERLLLQQGQEQQGVRVLEKGHVFFFYRPKIDATHPKGIEDVQKLYMLLSPDTAIGQVWTDSESDGSSSIKTSSSMASVKKEDDKDVKTEEGRGEGDKALHRLLIIPHKALPVSKSTRASAGSRVKGEEGETISNRSGALNWVFVDSSSAVLSEIKSRLQEYTYSTKTRGERTQSAARFIGKARYEIVLDHVDPQHPQRQRAYFIYELEIPENPGPVQTAFKIAKEGQFLVQAKNPLIHTPATERGAARYATLGKKAPVLPDHLQEKFRGVRKDEVRTIPLDSAEFLNIPQMEFMLIAVKRGAKERGELEELVEELEEEAEEDIEEEDEDSGAERVYKELEADENTIPDAVQEFK
ncbi:hypothetical protein FBU30_008939 [Linnemannia zychae]|nr:hypothetical protein FBU30_008939 [Linnemannia zychae]